MIRKRGNLEVNVNPTTDSHSATSIGLVNQSACASVKSKFSCGYVVAFALSAFLLCLMFFIGIYMIISAQEAHLKLGALTERSRHDTDKITSLVTQNSVLAIKVMLFFFKKYTIVFVVK